MRRRRLFEKQLKAPKVPFSRRVPEVLDYTGSYENSRVIFGTRFESFSQRGERSLLSQNGSRETPDRAQICALLSVRPSVRTSNFFFERRFLVHQNGAISEETTKKEGQKSDRGWVRVGKRVKSDRFVRSRVPSS